MNHSSRISQNVIPMAAALGVVILMFVLLSLWGESSKEHNMIIENGKLDLSDWDFQSNGDVRLDGGWEFYRDRLIMPEEFTNGSPEMTGAYPVPVYWTKYDGLHLPAKGDATYRLVVNVPPGYERLGISIPELYTEYALYINGQLLVGNGGPADMPFRYLDPGAYSFELDSNRVEIVLQIHNHSHVNAGIGQSLVLGTPESILRKDSTETAIDLIFVGICLFAGIYHFILFLNIRKDYKLLCFTLFCVAEAIRGLGANVTYVMEFFPALPFALGSRTVTETIPVLAISMLLYIYFMFPEYVSKRLVQGLIAVSSIYILLIIVTEPFVYSSVFIYYLLVPMIVCIMDVYVAVCAIRDKRREAFLYLAGDVFLVAGAINDTLVFMQRLDTGYRLGVGLAAFTVIQSLIMALQYKRYAEEREQLHEKLHETDLAFLQAQIRPHFLFNALSAISNMVGREPLKAKELLLDFSDYLRGSFNFNNSSGLTTLEKEMDVVKAYLSIEKARFQERLNVEYEIKENPDVLIPLLCIQPIVENAVRHGLMPRARGGNVKIKVWNEKGDTVIRVEDDGVGIPEGRLEEIFSGRTDSTGLMNINGRLKLKFGTEMKIMSRAGEGTAVEITVPRRPKTPESHD